VATRNTCSQGYSPDRRSQPAPASRRRVEHGAVIAVVAAVFSLGQPNELFAAPPGISLSANSNPVVNGHSVELSWAAEKATDCQASGAWAGLREDSGTETVYPSTPQSIYSLTCIGQNHKELTASVTVTVADANEPPSITSSPVTAATQDQPYAYDVEALDSDPGDALSYSLFTAPAGMSIDGTTGLVAWTPLNADVGDHPVTVRVTDTGGLFNEQSFTITVANVNEAPSITSSPVTAATQDQPYAYDVEALDPDPGDALSYSLTNGPAGMSIDGTTGLVAWTPLNADGGDHPVTVRVTDAGGLFNEQAFIITVVATQTTSTLSFLAEPSTVPLGSASQLTWNGNNVSSCTASGAWTGPKPDSGTETTGPLDSDRSYSLACTGDSGEMVRTVLVTVNQGEGTAELSWTPPTENADGSTLTDLAGYRIHYGTSPGTYTTTIEINNPGLSSYIVTGLTPGTYYFALTAFNASNISSDYSNEEQGTIL
jgi:hypothetical protein